MYFDGGSGVVAFYEFFLNGIILFFHGNIKILNNSATHLKFLSQKVILNDVSLIE